MGLEWLPSKRASIENYHWWIIHWISLDGKLEFGRKIKMSNGKICRKFKNVEREKYQKSVLSDY